MNEYLKSLTTQSFEHNYLAVAAALKHATAESGVEVGVRHGVFSEHLLQQYPDLHMVMVDPYEPYLDVGDYFFQQQEQEEIKYQALARMAKYPGRFGFEYVRSTVAAKKFRQTNRVFDFVFIDAAHEYSAVREDLEAWYPPILAGGLLMGHDYDMTPVRTAVNEQAAKLGKEVYHIPYPADVWIMEV